MSRVRARDTKPEKKARSILHGLGFRFALCRADLPGKPDIVLPKHHAVIFVHGCFWHRHAGCARTTTPKANAMYWKHKFLSNRKRDLQHSAELKASGWHVYTIWECEIAKTPTRTIMRIVDSLRRYAKRHPSAKAPHISPSRRPASLPQTTRKAAR